jgi:hypothetical protein
VEAYLNGDEAPMVAGAVQINRVYSIQFETKSFMKENFAKR